MVIQEAESQATVAAQDLVGIVVTRVSVAQADTQVVAVIAARLATPAPERAVTPGIQVHQVTPGCRVTRESLAKADTQDTPGTPVTPEQ